MNRFTLGTIAALILIVTFAVFLTCKQPSDAVRPYSGNMGGLGFQQNTLSNRVTFLLYNPMSYSVVGVPTKFVLRGEDRKFHELKTPQSEPIVVPPHSVSAFVVQPPLYDGVWRLTVERRRYRSVFQRMISGITRSEPNDDLNFLSSPEMRGTTNVGRIPIFQ